MRRPRTLVSLLCLLAAIGQSVVTDARADTLVERGRYLAVAGNCISCHTMPGGHPFTGGVAFETDFGTIHSTNITPDVATGLGKWTLEDFRRAMRHGVAPGGRRLFPAFPYTAYTKLVDADIEAIHAYLRSLAPKPAAKHPPNSLLFRMRWGMVAWNARYLQPGPMRADLKQSRQWNRGAYLVEALAHCSACHTPRNRFMAEDEAQRYAGGVINHTVAPGKIRRWSAVNISQHRIGLAQWSVEDIERYLAKGVNRWTGSLGPMNEVLVNSTMRLSEDDVRAMAVYLKSLPSRSTNAAAAPAQADANGAALYEEHCEECHMKSGRGGMFDGPPLAGSVLVKSHDPSSMLNVILHGPVTTEGVDYGSWETMEGYADTLSDAEIAAVANYIRASWKNAATAITPADVAAQR